MTVSADTEGSSTDGAPNLGVCRQKGLKHGPSCLRCGKDGILSGSFPQARVCFLGFPLLFRNSELLLVAAVWGLACSSLDT